MVSSPGLVPNGWTCFRATFMLCCILLLFGVSVCLYRYRQGDRSAVDYRDELAGMFLTNQGISRGISVSAVNAQARSPNETNKCVQQGNVSTTNVHQVGDTHQETKQHSKQDVLNTNQAKSTKEINKSTKEDNSSREVKIFTETKLHTKQDKSSTNQTKRHKEIKEEDNSPTVGVNQVKSSKETTKEDNSPTHQPSKESESPIDPLSSSRQDNSATHQINPPKEVKLDSKDKQDNSPSANVNQVKSSKETMKEDNSPTHQTTKESESPNGPLSSIIQMNSTHINGKLLEPIDTEWDKNIYFSVKTTAKYFKERLAALMPTWFQVINKKMLTVVSEKSDIGTAMATVMKEAGFNLLLTDCVGTHTRDGLCCKTGSEFAAYYEAVDKYQDERKSFEWFCHFDDDVYVNVPELNNLLQQHDPRKPYYIGSSDKPKVVHQVENDTLEKLKQENITVASDSYQLASGAAYCISHPLMMELKHLLNGGKAFSRMCALCDRIDDHMVGFSIVSILGYSRELSGKIKTQQSKHLDSVTLKDMLKYVCVSPNGTTKQKYLEPYAESINMSVSEDPTRFLTYHCLLYPTVSWCHK